MTPEQNEDLREMLEIRINYAKQHDEPVWITVNEAEYFLEILTTKP